MSTSTTTADAPDLRWARAEAITEVVERIRKDLAAALIGANVFATLSKQLRFRDSGGVYWAPGLTRSQWFQFAGGTWQLAGAPPALIEGPSSFDGYAPRSAPRSSSSRDAAPDAGGVDPVRGIEQLTRSRVTDYQTGALSSRTLESLLASLYLLDREGIAWRLGVRSNRWYRFEGDRGWQPVGTAPDPAALMSPEVRKRLGSPTGASAPVSACPECNAPTKGTPFCTSCGTRIPAAQAPIDPGLAARVEAFNATGRSMLPEAVVDAWNPPTGDPEQALTCPSCKAVNEAGAQRCRHCGMSFGPAANSGGRPSVGVGASTSPAGASAVRRCPSCAANVESPTSKFCRSCGGAVPLAPPPPPPQPKQAFCGSCGQSVPSGVKFCVHCGSRTGG